MKAVLHPAEEALVIIRGQVPGGAMGMQDLTHWIKVNEGLAVARGPYESVTISTSNDDDPRMTEAQGADIAYCAMLYGKTDSVRKHTTGAMLRGWQLRRDVAPIIRERYTFANVLFVEKDSIDVEVLKSVAVCWSIVFVDVPKVHETRLRGVSEHLKDGECDNALVIMEHEAFHIKAKLAVISDLDLTIFNKHNFALELLEFVSGGKEKKLMLDKAEIACMAHSPKSNWTDETHVSWTGRNVVKVRCCLYV